MSLPVTMEFTSNNDFINQMLFSYEIGKIHLQDPFLVHSAIYPMVQKYLTRLEVCDLQHLGSYELTVGANKFDMEILVLGIKSMAIFCSVLFRKFVKISQLTYFWDNRITLFREVDRYYELEEFIADEGLKKHVISVEEVSGVNSLGQNIKLVTFDSTSDEIQRDELLVNYEKFLRGKSMFAPYPRTYHYYFTRSFPWHTSEMVRMYSRPFLNQRIFLELQTFLTCMRELTYNTEPHLDLIGLCSLKLAFCNDLNLTGASRDLEFEIDALIERFLRRMVKKETYIKNGKFDLHRYAVDTNFSVKSSDSAIHNLIYTFQHIFHCSNLYVTFDLGRISFTDSKQTLFMNDENTELKLLRDRSNIRYIVDTQTYSKMNAKLFCELLKCRNVDEIVLDTNYRWANSPYFMDIDLMIFHRNSIMILLQGTNQFNFIEDFIQFLKTMPTSVTCSMLLKIVKITLNSYHIFKNLKVFTHQFYCSKITFTMLTELLDGDLKSVRIHFAECTIEDTSDTWSLLINGFNRENVTVEILEEEKTWQYLFESIANHLTKFKRNEFNFKCSLEMITNCFGRVCVSDMTFRFDEFNTRLELQNKSGQAIDLYDWKNNVNDCEDDYKNFEFYQ